MTEAVAVSSDPAEARSRYREGLDVPTSGWAPGYTQANLIGCSFSFETALLDAGVPVRNLDQGRNVAMYRTNIACRPAGRLSGPLVVSMRPIPASQIVTAVGVTAQMP